MSMPASVVMKPGMPTYATQKPCQQPMTNPTRSEMRMASIQLTPCRSINIAQTPPTKATIEPTDKSIWVAMMTMTMPIARMIT